MQLASLGRTGCTEWNGNSEREFSKHYSWHLKLTFLQSNSNKSVESRINIVIKTSNSTWINWSTPVFTFILNRNLYIVVKTNFISRPVHFILWSYLKRRSSGQLRVMSFSSWKIGGILTQWKLQLFSCWSALSVTLTLTWKVVVVWLQWGGSQ